MLSCSARRSLRRRSRSAAFTVGSSSISTSPALTACPSSTRMERTTPVSNGWMTLVRDQNARVADERAGNRDALALAAGESRAALADDRVVAFGQLEDEFVRSRQPCRGDDALH